MIVPVVGAELQGAEGRKLEELDFRWLHELTSSYHRYLTFQSLVGKTL